MSPTCRSCGQPIAEGITTVRVMINGTAYTFCSAACVLQVSGEWVDAPPAWGGEEV